jgi:hypothetical protein
MSMSGWRRHPLSLIFVGLALAMLLVGGAEPPHPHDDGLNNADCEISALAALGSCAAVIVQGAAVLGVAPAVADARPFTAAATPPIAVSSVDPRAPPRV